MNLLEAVRDIAASPPGPDWLSDEVAFHRHFGVPYETFAETVSCLTESQLRLLHQTLEVNPEAAVLWILHMEVVG